MNTTNAPLKAATDRCLILTPAGRGAVAVIAVLGPGSAKSLDLLFSPATKAKWSAPDSVRHKARQIRYGFWNSTGEDVVVVQLQSEHFEIHCHGGHSAPDSILQSLVNNGFQELTHVAGAQRIHSSRWKSEVALALADAITERTATILLQQFSITDTQIAGLDKLINGNSDAALTRIDTMLDWGDFGLRLTQPRSVVFCGRPNVGKSSLVNQLVGFNRVIVHETAGTTRDVVSATTAVHGWPIEIKDTAGLRESENEIERQGIVLTETQIQSADLVVAVFDARHSESESQSLLESLSQSRVNAAEILVVLNKTDLLEAPDQVKHFDFVEPRNLIRTSAKTGTGIAELVERIACRLVSRLPPADLLIPISPTQTVRLKKIRELISTNATNLASDLLLRVD